MTMESVIFEGKEFVKASVLAKRFSYTPDYLGQLCRGKKVDARLVGRSWYINLDSLHEHRGNRYKGELPNSNKPIPTTAVPPQETQLGPHYLSRVDVEPILKGKTVRLLKGTRAGLKNVSVRYESDDNALIPKIARGEIKRDVPIDLEGSEVVAIQKETVRPVLFKPEPIPEVYLRGKITVEGLSEAMEEVVENEEKNTANTSHTVRTAEIVAATPSGIHTDHRERPVPKLLIRRTLRKDLKIKETLPATKHPQGTGHPPSVGVPSVAKLAGVRQHTIPSTQGTSISVVGDFTPVSVKNIAKAQSKSAQPSLWRFFPLLLLGVFGLAVFMTFFVRSDVLVENGFTNTSYELDFDRTLLQRIATVFSD